jgi:hypothetical protein
MESWAPESDKNKYTELRELFLNAINKIEFAYCDSEMKKFYSEIKEKYPSEEYRHSLLWHLIIGSTPDKTDIYFDTPEGDIQNFITNRLPAIAKSRE